MVDSARALLCASAIALFNPQCVARAAEISICALDVGDGQNLQVPMFGAENERFLLAIKACAREDARPEAEALALFPEGLAFAAIPDIAAILRAPSRSGRLSEMIAAAARAHGLDPLLLDAIVHVESRHRPHVVSSRGAIGLMQLMPSTARRFGIADPYADLFDEARNLDAGAAYLASLSARYAGRLDLMLAAYNAGEGAVARYGESIPPFQETRAYVAAVTARYEQLRAQATR